MQVNSVGPIEIPESLRQKLLAFRRRVWIIKMIEAVAGVLVGVFAGYLLTYCLDRLIDTPRPVRWSIFALSVLTCALIPFALERWVWRRRRLDQLARLLSHKHPSVGDQLLGIIELARSSAEQRRSPVLVQAAIRQVSEVAEQRDFRDSVPNAKHRQRSWTAVALASLAAVLLIVTTAAATNAWTRFLKPWSDTPRYTFAAIESLPDRMVVAHGEPFPMAIKLTEDSQWKPEHAVIELPGQTRVQADRNEDRYQFEVPGQIAPATLRVRLGDYAGETSVEPMLRPEISALSATISLPEYLERKEPIRKDIRGGSLTAVKGSAAVFTAVISRELSEAAVDQQERAPQGQQFTTDNVTLDGPRELELTWVDRFGLSAQQPFKLTIEGTADEAPSLVCEDLPRQQVLLDTEIVSFQVRARDDFGVKRVGIQWEGLDTTLANPCKGEAIIGAGNSTAEFLELAATFSAAQFKIEPQPIAVRVFVEDYLPGRERAYSPTCTFDVLNAEQHAIWVVAQLSRWHRMSLDVRDREMQLHEVNKELRSLPTEELDTPETRQRIEVQASAEKSNGRRLSLLTASGEDLLKQAMRNPEIGVGHLEKWAEMMQILKDIAGNRMPSVSDLLKDAASAPQVAQNSSSNRAPKAGENRANVPGGDPKKGGEPKPASEVPTIADIESTHNQAKNGEPKSPTESKGSQPRLTLPTTNLVGNGNSGAKKPSAAAEKVDEAVEQQQDLLAEFEKIADELNTVLANLEGSTLVKRLKASSRRQQQVATKLGSLATDWFGVAKSLNDDKADAFVELAKAESSSSQDVSNIMDDMAAYFDRSRYMRFKVVLDDMRKQDITGGLRQLSDDLRKENGLSVAQAEFWSESLDRWAEDLVEVTKCGACPGCKAKGSLPPSIVLEVLQILEAEVGLREQTRVTEQSKPAVSKDEHATTAKTLSDSQRTLQARVDKVVGRILELPDAETDFSKELALLGQVSKVMAEATDILATPNTGAEAVAAETEAIELLLKSKRINPGGGGGGSDPGGGGGGTTTDSALALVGTGVNDKEVREDRGIQQDTGSTGPTLPEEYRAGLDEYFNRLDRQE